MRHPSVFDRLPAWAWLVLGVVAVVASFRLGLGDGASAAAIGPVPVASDARGSLAGYRVRLTPDSLVDLAPADTAGAPAVVMVSSVTCAVCAETLRDLGAQRTPLPDLRIVTLEGAAAGEAMARGLGLAHGWHAGPADGSGATLLTFQFPGTPTFLLVEPGGRVRRALVGYPGREAFAPWVRVMRGEASSL